MGFPEKLAKMRFNYYTNMLSVNNILNQLGLMSDKRANMSNKYYFYKAMDAFSFMSQEDIKELKTK